MPDFINYEKFLKKNKSISNHQMFKINEKKLRDKYYMHLILQKKSKFPKKILLKNIYMLKKIKKIH